MFSLYQHTPTRVYHIRTDDNLWDLVERAKILHNAFHSNGYVNGYWYCIFDANGQCLYTTANYAERSN